MKTNYYSSTKLSIYGVFGLFALLLTSCGSYQNKSYYDNDGIYGTSTVRTETNDDKKDNEKYREYFSSLNQENQETFTDVENYTSFDTINKNSSNQAVAYNGWGSNGSDNVTINVYDNNWGWNNWGWGWNNWYGNGWGWNNWGWNSWYGPGWGWNSWYGPNWGWGWNSWYGPNWGWGWNSWYGNGWGWNNYYGNHYAFVNGRRDVRQGYFNGGRTTTINRSMNNNGVRNPRSFSTIRNTTRSTTIGPRVTNGGTRTEVSSPTRGNSPTRNNTSTAPTRSYSETPRSTSTPRSYSGGTRSSSSGGGYSGGGSSGGGGGRSGGGGGRR